MPLHSYINVPLVEVIVIEYILAGWLSLPPLDFLGLWNQIKNVVVAVEPSPSDYQKVLKDMSHRYDNLTLDGYYKNTKFKTGPAGKTKAVPELTQLEKDVFYLTEAEQLSAEMNYYYRIWDQNSKIIIKNRKNKKPDALVCPLRPRPATAEETAKFTADLFELRKKLASKEEAMTVMLYENHADVFTRHEAEYNIRTMQQQHDQEKLVERPKK